MTTIAFDGRYMVSDGRSTSGNMITGQSVQKVFHIDGIAKGKEARMILAGAGTFEKIYVIKGWLESGADPFSTAPEHTVPLLESMDFEGMLFIQDLGLFDLETGLIPMPAEGFGFGGSGGCFAYTAMKMGKSAEEAVKVAMEIDIGSGGNLTIFDTVEWRFDQGGS